MSCRLAVADAEISVAESEVALIQRRVQSLNRLHSIQYASWIELDSAKAELVEATAALDAAREYSEWIHRIVAQQSQPHFSQLSHRKDLFIHLQLPDSHAVLGWLNVAQCRPDVKAQLLNLFESRAALLTNPATNERVAQSGIDALEETLSRLRDARGDSEEMRLLEIQLSAARASKTLAEAQKMFVQAEQRQLLDLIDCARLTGLDIDVVQESPRIRNGSLPYHKWQRAILNSEASASGAIEIAGSLHDWSKGALSASQSLHQQGFVSSQYTADKRSAEANLTQALETARDRRQFIGDWSARLRTNDAPEVDLALPCDGNAAFQLTDEIMGSPQLLEMACNIYRERTILKARLAGIENRRLLYEDLIEKLKSQKAANLQETRNAELLMSLLDGQRRQIEEELLRAKLAQNSISDLGISQRQCAVHLSDIDEEAAHVVVLAAWKSGENSLNRSVFSERMARRTTLRIHDLESLYEQGNASRREILSLLAERDELLVASELHDLNAQQSNIDCQLVEAVIALGSGTEFIDH